MANLFVELARHASDNARREVETYAREIPELASLDANSRARAKTLEYALWLRRRTNELSPDHGALTPDDLGCIASMGELRADAGLSLDSRQRILRVHTALMLREVHEAAEAQRGGAAAELTRLMGWFAQQGERGIGAYCQGFVTGLRHRLPYTEQVSLLAHSLLTQDPMAAELARALGMELPEQCAVAVTVVRVPDRTLGDRDLDSALEALVKAHRVPVTWNPGNDGGGGGELIALVPNEHGMNGPDPEPVPALATELVQDFAETLGRPCAAGTATAPPSELDEALTRARRISDAAPLRRAPARVGPHTMADVFVELAVADVPSLDHWLRTVARRLEPGPDLLTTLDAYYRRDMNRATTAAALNVHPRTLDYRLRRVRELTGIDPGSTRGVRILSSAVARHLS